MFTYRNKLDEDMGLIGLHVSDSFLFHIAYYKTFKSSWDKLASLFGKVNEFLVLQLEAEFSFIFPNEHGSIEYYLSKFRSLVAQLKGCGKSKSDDGCIFLMLSKLKGPYQGFISTFYSTMDALGDEFEMPYFEIFWENLTREQFKIMQPDALSNSKNQSLLAHSSKGKKKSHYKKKKYYTQGSETPSKPQHKTKSSPPSKSSNYSSKTKKKTSNETCIFYNGPGNPESKCWKKLEALN
jgi:hypothetical protein